jgi:hypothetical protein
MKFLPIVLAVLVTFAGGTAASASTADPPPHPYTIRLLRAVDTCEANVTHDTKFRQVVACVRGIAAPQPTNTAEVDIWRAVLDCLWQWAISDKRVHEALLTEHDFTAAQQVSAQHRPADGSSRTYLLVGPLRCGVCGRSMQSQLSHGCPAYRCRHGHTSAHTTAMRQASRVRSRPSRWTRPARAGNRRTDCPLRTCAPSRLPPPAVRNPTAATAATATSRLAGCHL